MEFQNIERIIEYINKHNKANMTLVMSTPQTYINALKAENITWPVKYDDMFPYAHTSNDYWTGYFSSRPAAKKQVKDASSLFSAEMKLFSERVITENVKASDVSDVLLAKQSMLESLSIYQHHDAITGTAKQYVADDYSFRMQRSIDFSSKTYFKELSERLARATGIKAANLSMCVGSNNFTVHQCPIDIKGNNEKLEFIVIAHNQADRVFDRFIKVKLPHKAYRAQVWNKTSLVFTDVVTDVMEQSHFSLANEKEFEFEMYVPHRMEANEVSFIKVI